MSARQVRVRKETFLSVAVSLFIPQRFFESVSVSLLGIQKSLPFRSRFLTFKKKSFPFRFHSGTFKKKLFPFRFLFRNGLQKSLPFLFSFRSGTPFVPQHNTHFYFSRFSPIFSLTARTNCNVPVFRLSGLDKIFLFLEVNGLRLFELEKDFRTTLNLHQRRYSICFQTISVTSYCSFGLWKRSLDVTRRADVI